eukprot:GILJ01005456.1.p1 GENE.GILJ01005456.1~~GILJ01005456.1.p1  ORF type:complete len:434 (-),score=44.09 GILJ01005456.1:89-1348(-)
MATHMLVAVHGLWGNPSHVQYVAKSIEQRYNEAVMVHLPRVNVGIRTYHGIDVCGERLYQDIVSALERNPQVNKFSILGYSAGGLYSRYAVGRLYQEGYFDDNRITPVNFITFACPHLGVRRSPRSLFNRFYNCMPPYLLWRAGAQFAVADDDTNPLLHTLTMPDSVFMAGLKQFKCLVAYANTQNDRTVPYSTASLSARNPYRKAPSLTRLEGYPNIISVRHLHTNEPPAILSFAEKPSPPLLSSFVSAFIGLLRVLLLLCFLPLVILGLCIANGVARCTYPSITIPSDFRTPQPQQQHTTHSEISENDILPELSPDTAQVEVGTKSEMENMQMEEERDAKEGLSDDTAESVDSLFAVDSKGSILREMYKNLRSLPWKIVDVAVEGGHTHGHIIVRHTVLHAGGKDVVKHCVDCFQLS